MARNFEHSVALRYLFGAQGLAEGRRLLRFVTTIAVIGVAVGVCALIVSLSIVRGFSNEIEAKIIGFGAQVQVENYRDAPLEDAGPIRDILANNAAVTTVSPIVQEFVLLRGPGNRSDGVRLTGVESMPPYLGSKMISGGTEIASKVDGVIPMIIGLTLARNLNIGVGDRVHAFSVRGRQQSGSSVRTPRLKEFRIIGVYETSLADFDEVYVFVPIESARDLLEYGEEDVTRFELTLGTGVDSKSAAEALDDELEFPVMARSIEDVYRSLFAWVKLQESIIPLVIGIIVLVAAFNIIGTLLMIILEKTREIGVFASMGASRRMLKRIFLYLGLYIGIAGILIGESTALILSWLQLRFSIIPLPKEAYYMSTAPIEMSALDFLVVAVITIILCAVSAYIPARFAARIEPIRAIHLQ